MTDLVVQLGARLDQFAADMNKAGDLADGAISRIEGAFSSLNPGLGGPGHARHRPRGRDGLARRHAGRAEGRQFRARQHRQGS
ncbi:hypothetical protein [Bradyrhizobium sp. SZCCHNS3053]|uniref:hypothetical protein n=1 Tax=Bradyrhizobium sp. SZCCHNS3053 TaxID=3057322 RepID=UPI0029165EBD|nr:hypothetical protein [Bradyrhizobium sp. SZCCHNS3053]